MKELAKFVPQILTDTKNNVNLNLRQITLSATQNSRIYGSKRTHIHTHSSYWCIEQIQAAHKAQRT